MTSGEANSLQDRHLEYSIISNGAAGICLSGCSRSLRLLKPAAVISPLMGISVMGRLMVWGGNSVSNKTSLKTRQYHL